MFEKLRQLGNKTNDTVKYEGKIQSFTFYIPSPPERKIGYREKQFDKLFYEFINQGFEILSINTQANTNPNHSGMWFICIVRALNEKAEKLSLDNFFNEEFSPAEENKEQPNGPNDIEGFYIIDDDNARE